MASRVPVAPTIKDIENKIPFVNTWFKTIGDRMTVYTRNSDPSIGDVPENQWIFWYNTSSGKISIWMNKAGTLLHSDLGAGSTGTVTTVSVASANGFAGSVATATTTPVITLTTTLTGLLKGNGTAMSAAVAGTDYAAPSQTFFLGTTSIAINRASSALALTGITSIDGNAATVTTNANLTGPITSIGNATTVANNISLPGSPTTTTQTAGDASTKVATTQFVQTAVLQSPAKEAAKYATIAVLPSIVYANGASGVGATLTGVGVGALSVDGSAPVVGNRILVKNQASTFQNGVYTVTATGSAVAVFVLTRTSDFDQSSDIETGSSLFVTNGTTLASTTWDVNSADAPVMGTDAITFAQTAGPGTITSGNGITVTGASVAIDTSVTIDKTTAQALSSKTITSSSLDSTPIGASSTSTGAFTTLTTTGRAGVGSSTNAVIGLVNAVNITGATTAYGFRYQGTIQSDVTTAGYGYSSQIATQASAFTVTDAAGYFASQGTIGAASAITNLYGYLASATLVGGTNNYGFFGQIASGTGRWNFYGSGTAANFFNGTTTFGSKLGYGTQSGVGGAVSQGTSKATGVTLNTSCGAITMNAASLAAGTSVSFTLTNSQIGANDAVICHRKSGGTAGAYDIYVDSVAAGSCVVRVKNNTAGALLEAVVLTFSVISGTIS